MVSLVPDLLKVRGHQVFCCIPFSAACIPGESHATVAAEAYPVFLANKPNLPAIIAQPVSVYRFETRKKHDNYLPTINAQEGWYPVSSGLHVHLIKAWM